jgi:hypothetical protein
MGKLLYDESGHSRFDLKPLADLLGREWWSRIWVLQEARYAGKTYFQCGRRHVKYEAMLSIAVCCTHLGLADDRNRSPAKRDLGRNAASATDTLWLSRAETGWGFKHLLWVLNRNTPYYATLKQDRVYGLLGLAADADEIGVVVDYNASCEDIYTDVTERLLRRPGGLDILCFSMSPKSMVLPSWVPDWSMTLGQHLAFAGQFTKRCFSASLRHEARLGEFGTDGDDSSVRLMRASGVTFDTISAVLDHQWPDDVHFQNALPFFQAAQDFVRAEATAYEDVEDVVWRVFSMDLRTSDEVEERRSHEQTRVAFHDLNAYLQSRPGPEARGLATDTLKYFISCARLLHKRKLLRTSTGYIGVGRQDSKQGDQVCVLYGVSVQLTLRPVLGRRNRFEVVGEAWVHGIMDGEFLATDPLEETFALQ